MCLINHQGRTNAENICYYRPYHITYKCGHCAECIKEKRNEWLLRSYFESKDTLERNGYILFETLTYRDSKLPHISKYYKQLTNTENDFSCFSYEDVRKFTNLLWTTINRKLPDYNTKESIKFFLVSEYGHEDIYTDNYGRIRKGTFRPHYHVLFYVKDKKLHPGTLMKLIAKCWKNGNTDFSQNGISYAMKKNVIGKGYTKDKVKNIIAVSNYVSKYITKQGDFMEKIEKRINYVTSTLIEIEQKKMYSKDAEKGVLDYSKIWNYRKEVMNYISPFHRQSRGFGICAIEDDNIYQEICNKMKITIPDYKYIKKTYNVPMYYIRKLFYELVRIDDEKYRWQLNSLGKLQYPKILEIRCNNIADNYFKKFQNLSSKSKEDIINLLDGRGWKELAEYIVYYRGRTYDPDKEYINEETGEISSIPSINYIIESDINHKATDNIGIYSNGTNIVKTIDLRKFANDEEDSEGFQNMFNEFMDSLWGNSWYYCNEDIPYSMFEKHNIINENCSFEFRNFDKIICYISEYFLKSNKDKQEAFDYRENVIKKLQNLGLKCKN